jgi:sensor histidine kinase YesM
MTIDPAIANSQLPPLILQPIVENAIKHGLSPKRESGWLKIQAEQAENSLRLTVEDNGAGWNELPSAKISSRNQGVGLKNVRERLLTIYEGHADLQISSNFAAETGQGTQITITIPLSHQDEAQNADHRRRSFGAVAPAEAARRAS